MLSSVVGLTRRMTVERILKRLYEGSLLPASMFQDIDADAILDARDSDRDFECQWMQIYHEIEERWKRQEMSHVVNALVKDIRKQSFLRASNSTKQHEIASYISDDFDLIARALILDYKNDFLDTLWLTYTNGKIPHPERE